jgi:hypothetical protein
MDDMLLGGQSARDLQNALRPCQDFLGDLLQLEIKPLCNR